MKFAPTLPHHILVVILLLVGQSIWIAPVAAQGGESATGGGTTIHVVQRNENLFRIAMQYGTTVEAIAAANGITDPRYISVGQRLLIPNVSADTGVLTLYTVMPGDTLETLAINHDTSIDNIIAANRITNPKRLFIGADLTIGQGTHAENTPQLQAIHHVAAGENLLRVALTYRVPWQQIATMNGMPGLSPLFAGQSLRIPGERPTGTPLRDLPLPLTSFTLTPTPAIQGKTLSFSLTTEGPATLTGTFIGYPVQFVTHDGNRHNALFGIHAFTDAGVYPLEITITNTEGRQTTQTFYLRLDEGGYGTEAISLTSQQQDLLNPQVTEPEWELVARTMSTFTSQRYFDGLMGLPSTGAITSRFGTRRAYNGGELNTFHSGTDFGGAPGSPIVASAAGVVILTETLPVRGRATIIDHGWGVTTGYWHQSEIRVAVGDVVSAGQIIGTIGSTGRSTGPHLHWEMWVGGVQVDPMQWVQQPFP